MQNKIYISYNAANPAAIKTIDEIAAKFGKKNIILSPSLGTTNNNFNLNGRLEEAENNINMSSVMLTLLDNNDLCNDIFKYENILGFFRSLSFITLNIDSSGRDITKNPFTSFALYFNAKGDKCHPMEWLVDDWDLYEILPEVELEEKVEDELRDKLYEFNLFLEIENWHQNKQNIIKKISHKIS